MVYCSNCGTQNADDAVNCVNCGASLYRPEVERPYWRHRRYREYYGYYDYHRGSGAIGALIIGIIIVVIGLVFLTAAANGTLIDWNSLWAVLLILVGVWILVRIALWHRRY
jgi:hypothetical protein